MRCLKAITVLSVLVSVGCTGAIGDPAAEREERRREIDVSPNGDHLVQIGLRRLTPYEYDNTVQDLLGLTARPSEAVLPLPHPDEDEDFPFETHFEAQQVSSALIAGAETLAREAVADLRSDSALLDRVVGCTPAGPDDEECMQTFIEEFGRRAFRRPLDSDDVARYLELQRCSSSPAGEGARCGFAIEADDFYEGVAAILEAMLISPRFLYRVEVGTDVGDGVYRLDGFEIAARLSYLLWGTTPDDAMLDLAAAGELADAAQVRSLAENMLADPRARGHVSRFHALWLGYGELSEENELSASMQRETDALLERVIFEERRPWSDIFVSDETFVDDQLAEHYGLPTTGGAEPRWTSYPAGSGRGGILSHGSFLSVGAVGGDTRPIHRGKHLMTILLCQPIPPPPANVMVEVDPTGCKAEQLAVHSTGVCAGCHQYMDGLGNGLERYDGEGRYREQEFDDPTCDIAGEGAVPPLGESEASSFQGPGELGDLIVESGRVQACAATQLFRFAIGRNVRDGRVRQPIHEEDLSLVNYLIQNMGSEGRFDELVLELVSSPFFLHRVEY